MPDPINWSLSWPYLLTALVFGYLLGSIPFGYLLTRFAGLGDVRSIGSGNIGATNVLRTGNKPLAALTLLGDLLKGTAAVQLALSYGLDTAVMAGLGAFLGHLFPIWLKFKGGKGVATFIGITLGLYWPSALVFAGSWLVLAFVSRYSSLSALISSVIVVIFTAFLNYWQFAELYAVLTILLWLKHHQNIRRLLKGKESKIGGSKAADKA
uniref:glycerol-3-phosphate 1-O-acyltransferase PlsY n=1 Tax=Pararhizobium sp. IMCC3301 TaxID=3067904 RepID=UPI0027422236|nr:glycerol-3-phosphate 1-O-acyltransferase PlsY [Pararhizobium sp. IMCC3301]